MCLVRRHRPAREALGHVLAGHEFHRQKPQSVEFVQPVNGGDVRVVHRRQDFGLALKPREPFRVGGKGCFLSILWAVSLHLVTAFLFAGLPARPFRNTALLGPRFLATAFTAGPALIIIVLAIIRRFTEMDVSKETINKLALVVTVAAQGTLVMLISELFVEFYRSTHHGESARYLYFGLDGKTALVPWIWTSIGLNLAATVALSIHRVRRPLPSLLTACGALFVAIEIEKGMGTIIPGFIPEPWGNVVEYFPTWVEWTVSLGLLAAGCFVFTVLAKVAIPIESRRLRWAHRTPAPGSPPQH